MSGLLILHIKSSHLNFEVIVNVNRLLLIPFWCSSGECSLTTRCIATYLPFSKERSTEYIIGTCTVTALIIYCRFWILKRNITYTSYYHLLFINSIYIGIFSTLPAAWYQESLCDIIITGNCTISTLHIVPVHT